MTDLVDRLHDRANSYRQSGPSAEHTARLLDEAAIAIASAESSADYNAAMAEPLRQRIAALQDAALLHAEKIARAESKADYEAERAGNALNAVDAAIETLEQCQRVLAMMVAPDAIQQSTVTNAYAQAVKVEALVRQTLADIRPVAGA